MTMVVRLSFNDSQAPNEWIVESWSDTLPGNVTTVGYPDVEDALRQALYIFQTDAALDAILKGRAEDALLAANAATIASNKAALKTAEGL